MSERMGANGMPIKKKETIQEIANTESNNMIQEILEENPNAGCNVCEEDPCVCDDLDGEEE